MARCPDCIHFSLCDYNTNIAGDAKIKLYYDEGAEKCSFFTPTADVVEVKHGRWLDNIKTISTVGMADINAFVGYKCSECGRTEIAKEPYCNCGAKMDGRGI